MLSAGYLPLPAPDAARDIAGRAQGKVRRDTQHLWDFRHRYPSMRRLIPFT